MPQERLRDVLLSEQRGAAAFSGRTERQTDGIAMDRLDRSGKRTVKREEEDDD